MFDATTQTFANVLFDKLEEQGVDPKMLAVLKRGPEPWRQLGALLKLVRDMMSCPDCDAQQWSFRFDSDGNVVTFRPRLHQDGLEECEPHTPKCLVAAVLWAFDEEFRENELTMAFDMAVLYDKRRTNALRSVAKRKANGTKPKPPKRHKPYTSDRRFL